ncbi:MAG TPA: alpha-mannosidase [Candidatus Gallacutalibacter stercoravium]|nr:alpha-mannosidase [Candidatus Gallacutalibacter stercoravium]
MLNEKQTAQMMAKLTRLQDTLQELMFEKVDEVPVCWYKTEERLHRIPDDGLFTPCKKGDQWGGEGAYCWFKGSYTVPDRLAGQTLYLYPHVGGYEGFMWLDGKPFGNYASKLGNHYCNYLFDNAKAGDVHDIAVEYYAGHYVIGCSPLTSSPMSDFLYQVESMDICVKNEQAADFLFDLKVLCQAVECMDKDSYRRADILAGLYEVHNTIYYSYEDAGREAFFEGLARASGILKEKLSRVNSQTTPFAGLVGHSHMDTAWLWTVPETEKKCARTYSKQISLMEQYPEYIFTQSSAFHSDMMRRDYPELFAEIQKKVKEGRYEPNGGVWVECDCNIVSGESLVRQFLWGQRFTRKYFDYTSDTFWLPDTFGYSAAIPQVMKGCGVKYFLTTKMNWNDTNKFPYDTFYWQGMDGTKVLTHLNRIDVWPEPKALMEFVVKGSDSVREKSVSNMRLLSYGYGDGGGGPMFEELEMARRLKDFEGLPRAEHITVSDFMQRLEKTSRDPSVYSGELYLELHRGTLTNQHTIKRNNRLAEIGIHDLEFLEVRKAIAEGRAADSGISQPLLSTLLVNQFHDILPGTCIPQAHQESIAETTEMIQKTNGLIASHMGQQPKENTVSLVNTLSFDRSDVVYLDYQEGMMVDGGYAQQVVTMPDGSKKLAVAGVAIPAFSAVTLTLGEGTPAGSSAFAFEGNVLTTPFAKVTFNDKGAIESFIDTAENRELRGEGFPLNTFLIAEDVSANWDNWDVDADIQDRYRDSAVLLSREVVGMGPVECRIRSLYQLTDKSTLRQDMIFFANSPEVRFETVMDWNDDHRFLKTCFDTTVFSDFARNEVQFGYVKRPTTRSTDWEKAKFEVCNHKYTDLSEPYYGVAVLNDCKYGVSVEGSKIRLSLHKGGNRPDYTGDHGEHACTYSFLPHSGGFNAQTVVRPAYALNYKPLCAKGELSYASLLQVDKANIIAETIKPCEDSENAYIVRLYECEGARTQAQLTVPGAKGMAETNMLEEVQQELTQDQSAALTFRPFEIKTVKVRY